MISGDGLLGLGLGPDEGWGRCDEERGVCESGSTRRRPRPGARGSMQPIGVGALSWALEWGAGEADADAGSGREECGVHFSAASQTLQTFHSLSSTSRAVSLARSLYFLMCDRRREASAASTSMR